MSHLGPDSLVSHYRVISQLGAGGMGEVWLAEDTRLDRKVAIKVLPAEFTEDSERIRRFTQEAKAASALNHPNIVSVYDIGESEAGRFIVMELVSGKTLRQVIAEDNSVATLFTLGGQMAQALAVAHAAGITHRDIKPDNIMVRDDGYVKMLDFGLARLLPTNSSDPEAATLARQTTPGTVIGTLAYMSPEQATGQATGSPSDIFSLGIVLYELATGQHPFKAETLIGYLHSITTHEPTSLITHQPDFPPALDDLILRMLDKGVGSRPSAEEVAQALQEIERHGTSGVLAARTILKESAAPPASRDGEGFWVAVLPFRYRGDEAELATLADELTEEIVIGLSRFSYLRVISRSSTLRYANEHADVRTVGKTLGARYVMEGSLRLAASQLRLSVQLTDASTGANLWVETYNRSFTPETILDLQDDLAARIVSTVADMNGVLPHTMGELLRQRDPATLTPYEAVLRGFAYVERLSAEEHAEVRSALERAVEQAPDYADSNAMLAMIYADEHKQGFNVRPNSLDRSLAVAQRAVEAAPTNHLAHVTLAQALFFRRDLEGFRTAAERAIALNPMDAYTTAFMGILMGYAGDWERGCALADKGMQLNSNHPGWYRFCSFFNNYGNRDYRAALDVALRINMPSYYYANIALTASYAKLGELTKAQTALRELLKQRPDFAKEAREQLERWLGPGELLDDVLDGLRIAGLEIVDDVSS